MYQGSMRQRRQGVVMQETLPRTQTLHQFRGWGRDIGRVVERAAGWPDPVLAAPELPGCSHFAPNAPHEAFMYLAHESQ